MFLKEDTVMNISWSYLDKRSATISAIKDRGNMQYIIDHTDDEIKEAKRKMGDLRSPAMDGMPHGADPGAGEDRLIAGIDEIDILKERYRQALEYMDWFVPAWEHLSDDERYVLETFYGDDNEYGSNVIYDIARHFNIEHTSAYKRKNRALDHLTTLLFGKG